MRVMDYLVQRCGSIPRDEGNRATLDLSVDRIFVRYVVGIFCELRVDGVLRSSHSLSRPFYVARTKERE